MNDDHVLGYLLTGFCAIVLLIALTPAHDRIRGDIKDLRSACVQEAPSEQP